MHHENGTAHVFDDFETQFQNVINFMENYCYTVTIYAILVNVFHVFILTKCSIPSSAIHAILIGIGIADTLSPSIYLKIAVNRWIFNEDLCKLPETHEQVRIDWVFSAIRDNFRRCSVWLGLLLSVFRLIAVMFAKNNKKDIVDRSSTGIITILTVFIISCLFSAFYIVRYQIKQSTVQWIPTAECLTLLEVNENDVRFPFIIEEIDGDNQGKNFGRAVHLYLTAIFEKIIPSLLLPITAIMLVLELRRTGKLFRTEARPVSQFLKSAEKTNKLVVYMTLTYVIIELPIGIDKIITATRICYEDA